MEGFEEGDSEDDGHEDKGESGPDGTQTWSIEPFVNGLIQSESDAAKIIRELPGDIEAAHLPRVLSAPRSRKKGVRMMREICSALMAVVLMLIVGVMDANAGKEEDIPLSDVPEKVLEAAQNAVPGIKLTEAEVEKTRKGLIYEIEGILDGKGYEIKVSADGKVLKIGN
jgi:hypothetical protein